MGTVTRFPNMPSDYSPKAILDLSIEADLKDVLVVGWKEDGTLFVRSSKMTRAEALFLNEVAYRHIMEV